VGEEVRLRLVRLVGARRIGADDRRTTVYLVGAETFTPASRKDGDPFRLITRLKEKRTSAEVSGVPSENLTSRRSVNVKVLASFDTFHERASHGSGVVDWPRNVTRVSYMPFTAICEVGSNIRWGSIVWTTNDVSTTRVPSALVLSPAAGAVDATIATTARTTPTSAAGRARRGTRAALCM
jgi:hypothetical protein